MAAAAAATIERYETASGWILNRTQKRTARCAVRRKMAEIGRRAVGS
jgi:hypothetical protein